MLSKNINILKNGGIGVIPTDTIYGLVCSAFSESALVRMFDLKGREENKPPVVIISKIKDLEEFEAKISSKHLEIIKKYWPGPLTIIFEISDKFKYLDKSLGLAIRLPADHELCEIIGKTGPLATTSANLRDQTPARNISEARNYFGDKVDFYEAGKEINSQPSTLIKIENGEVKVLRQGIVKVI